MTVDAPKRTAQFFDRYAREFDDLYGNRRTWTNRILNSLFRKSMKLRFERTLRGCDPVEGRTVLDVGCGPGRYSVELAERGAGFVVGLDFADAMIELARARAERAGVGDRCRFERADFASFAAESPFDYVVAMGFMDYAPEPRRVVEKILTLTRRRALISFPAAGGFLAWQRRLRYKRRCDLFLYREEEIRPLFEGLSASGVEVERIARDYFVTARMAEG